MAGQDHHVTLMTRPGCHLCETAHEALERIATETGATWETRDITLDEADLLAYGDRVPVILVDGVEHGFWRVEEDRLRAALAR